MSTTIRPDQLTWVIAMKIQRADGVYRGQKRLWINGDDRSILWLDREQSQPLKPRGWKVRRNGLPYDVYESPYDSDQGVAMDYYLLVEPRP